MSRNHDLKGKPNWFNKFLILESDASEIRSWTGERIPGILQSPHYMLGMFEADGIPDVTHFIRAREGRKAVLSGPHPPKCEFIISASYFKRLPHAFNGAIVRDQIQELIRAIDAHPHIAVLILPFEANLTYIPEDFTLFRLRDEKRQHVAWIENLHIGRETKKPDEVNQYHDRWNILRHTAMSRNESRAFLDNLLGEFERRP